MCASAAPFSGSGGSVTLSSRPSVTRAGTHTPCPLDRLRRMGPRLRGDDNKFLPATTTHLQFSNSPWISQRSARPFVVRPGRGLSFQLPFQVLPLQAFHSKWGVERRETRRLARPPERSEDRPERLGAFPFPLRSGKDASRRSTCGDFCPRGRSSVAGRKDSLQRSLPDRRGFRPRASRPVQPLKADPRSGAGRLPRASREQGCKPCARAPHPAPPSVCLRKTPQSRARREDYSHSFHLGQRSYRNFLICLCCPPGPSGLIRATEADQKIPIGPVTSVE